MPNRHFLKCWPHFFEQIRSGAKTFEIRFDDRDYSVGDTLLLREFNRETDEYSGKIESAEVIGLIRAVESPGLQEGFVCMSIRVGGQLR